MTLEYDEIRITTRREINVCEVAIRDLEKVIGSMEEKYKKTSADFLREFEPSAGPSEGELTRWHDSCRALERWKERLSDHRQIMKMYT